MRIAIRLSALPLMAPLAALPRTTRRLAEPEPCMRQMTPAIAAMRTAAPGSFVGGAATRVASGWLGMPGIGYNSAVKQARQPLAHAARSWAGGRSGLHRAG